MIDGFLIVGRRTRLDKAGVTNCLALPRTEGFPGTQDLHIRISWSPFSNRRWEKLRHLAWNSKRDETFDHLQADLNIPPCVFQNTSLHACLQSAFLIYLSHCGLEPAQDLHSVRPASVKGASRRQYWQADPHILGEGVAHPWLGVEDLPGLLIGLMLGDYFYVSSK